MNVNGRRRVVITGLGAVTPLGGDVRSSWESLVAGRSAAVKGVKTPIRRSSVDSAVCLTASCALTVDS
jgi:3-oxoacyl-[acyl-carrier-protein] synthase II